MMGQWQLSPSIVVQVAPLYRFAVAPVLDHADPQRLEPICLFTIIAMPQTWWSTIP
jgi:hypothetical protein